MYGDLIANTNGVVTLLLGRHRGSAGSQELALGRSDQ